MAKMRGLDALDTAFSLPENIEDPKLRELYEVLVSRMRKEAEGLAMNTVQQLLIERIAYNYIVMRSREAGDLGGFNTASVAKEFNSFWLSMTQEFNRLLSKPGAMAGHERKTLLHDIQSKILDTINRSVSDPKTRSDVLVNMAAALENITV